MATAPDLVVAGDPGVARKLRETGRFPAVFEAASAVELRDLSRSGKVSPPAAFMFAPGFAEDLPGAGVPVLANGLAGGGFTVLVHYFFSERGDVFDPKVRITGQRLKLSELLAAFGATAVDLSTEPTSAVNGHQPPETTARVPTELDAPPPKRGRVIAVASAKGGVGKTSTTVNLSVYAAKHLKAAGRGGSVALVDTNFQQADVARYLNLDSPTILDLLKDPGALAPRTVRGQLARVPDLDLYALLGPPTAINADPALINSALYQRILAVLREAFDFVFVDTPVAELYHATFTDLILPEADAVLVPVEPNRVSLGAASSWLKAITMPQHSRGGGVALEKLSLILNRARADVNCGPEDVMDLMPGWRFIGMIPEDREWTRAVNNHQLSVLGAGPELESTFRDILRTVTGDPVFDAAVTTSATGWTRPWRRLLGRGAR